MHRHSERFRYRDESCVQGDAERHERHSRVERWDDNRRNRNPVFCVKKYSALALLSVDQLHQTRLNRIRAHLKQRQRHRQFETPPPGAARVQIQRVAAPVDEGFV